MDEAPGLFVVHARAIVDDGNRERVLTTLHVDRGSFEQVAGLFSSVEEASEILKQYGDFQCFGKRLVALIAARQGMSRH